MVRTSEAIISITLTMHYFEKWISEWINAGSNERKLRINEDTFTKIIHLKKGTQMLANKRPYSIGRKAAISTKMSRAPDHSCQN